jgi:predicted RNA-binding protein associated with RNAse of E/G family
LESRPDSYAPHHIVPRDLKKFPEANDARKLLEDLGLDTNEAANGVYLPQTKAAAAGTSAQYHQSIHTEQYFINVEDRLKKAAKEGGPTLEGQRQAVIEELARIRRELENGTFPIR